MKNNLKLAALLSTALECTPPDFINKKRTVREEEPAEVRKLSDEKTRYAIDTVFRGGSARNMMIRESIKNKMLENIASVCRELICRMDCEAAKA